MTEKKIRGRPKLAASKSVMISARFTASEATEIIEAAKASGQPKTEWIQKILLSEARRINGNT